MTVNDDLKVKLELSLIYQQLLTDIFCVLNVDPAPAESSQCFQFISNAFGEAVGKLSSRCSYCDSLDVAITCSDCGFVEDRK